MTMNIREAEVNQAQSNPSIMSNLSGAQTSQPMTAPPQQMQDVAQGMTEDMYGSGFVQGGEDQREAMMRQLFEYDQMLEQQYNPLPSPAHYTQNPADMSRAMAGMAGQTAQNINMTSGAIDTTERAYQMATASVMDRFMDYLKHQDMMRLEREKMSMQGSGQSNMGEIMAMLFGGGQQQPDIGTLEGAIQTAGAHRGGTGMGGGMGGGSISQGNLIAALSAAKSPTDAKMIMDLYETFGQQGQMSDSEAYARVLGMPGGAELMSTIPANMKGDIARQIATAGSIEAAGIQPTTNMDDQHTIQAVNDLEQRYDNLMTRGRVGGPIGSLINKTGYLPEVQEYEAMRNSLYFELAGYFGLGANQMHTQEVKKTLNSIIPQKDHTPEEAKLMFAALKRRIERGSLGIDIVDEAGNVIHKGADNSGGSGGHPLDQFWSPGGQSGITTGY